MTTPAQDAVIEANRQLLLDRSNVGINKYGVTLEKSGLDDAQLVQHALEEALDLANYLQALLQYLKRPPEFKRVGMTIEEIGTTILSTTMAQAVKTWEQEEAERSARHLARHSVVGARPTDPLTPEQFKIHNFVITEEEAQKEAAELFPVEQRDYKS
jgi:hypothetical protein